MSNSTVRSKRAAANAFERVFIAIFSAGVVFSAGCTVGPKYNRPATATPPAFRGADDAAVVSDAQKSIADEQWAQVFREPELQNLIRTALQNNYDVRIAARRVLEQQAQVQITRSQEFPYITGGGTGIGASLPSNLGTSIASPLAFGSFNLGAAWTPDSGACIENKRKPHARSCWRRPGRNSSPADVGAAGGHHLHSVARPGPPTGNHPGKRLKFDRILSS